MILDTVKMVGAILGILGVIIFVMCLVAWFIITVASREDYRSYWAEREHVSLTLKQFVGFYNIAPENYKLFDFHAVYFGYNRHFDIAFDKGLFGLFKYTKWRERLARKENKEKKAQYRKSYMKLAEQHVESKKIDD